MLDTVVDVHAAVDEPFPGVGEIRVRGHGHNALVIEPVEKLAAVFLRILLAAYHPVGKALYVAPEFGPGAGRHGKELKQIPLEVPLCDNWPRLLLVSGVSNCAARLNLPFCRDVLVLVYREAIPGCVRHSRSLSGLKVAADVADDLIGASPARILRAAHGHAVRIIKVKCDLAVILADKVAQRLLLCRRRPDRKIDAAALRRYAYIAFVHEPNKGVAVALAAVFLAERVAYFTVIDCAIASEPALMSAGEVQALPVAGDIPGLVPVIRDTEVLLNLPHVLVCGLLIYREPCLDRKFVRVRRIASVDIFAF